MKPKEFFDVWCRTTAEKRFTDKLLNTNQYWYNATAKTSLMESEIYCELANELSYKYYVGYYHIDAVFYEERDRVPDIPTHTTTLRRIRIALEHENNFNRNLYVEFSHLLLTNCELRVLVAYPNDYDKDKKDVLTYLSKIISTNPSVKVENESILLIFGVKEKTINNSWRFFWEGHEYKEMKWEIIEIKYPENKYPIGILNDSL